MSELLESQYKDSTNFSARIELHRRFSTNRYPWPLWVFDNILDDRKMRVLEIGCGSGLLWKVNANRVPEIWDITLSDFSEGMLKDAEKYIGDNIKGITYSVVNAEDIPYEDETFDIIIANHMIYHLPDRGKAFGEIRRVLKTGGVFCATTMRKGYMNEMRELIREYRTGSAHGGSSNSVMENFSIENGEEQLREFFGTIDFRLYENTLVVDDAEPFVNYAYSLSGINNDRGILKESEREFFTEFINRKLRERGSILIPSDSGLFLCR